MIQHCTIVHVEENCDMRCKYDLVSRAEKRLKKNQCYVAINSARNMARVIDYKLGIHELHCWEQGETFDLAGVIRMMMDGMGIDLHVGRSESVRMAA